MKEITVTDLRNKTSNYTTIDVRSPSEYKEATIPGSINIPIFSDEERAEIGTLYKQVGNKVAMDKGLEILSKKLPSYIKEFEQVPGEKVIFCWRGGMRSKATSTLLDLMKIEATRLIGGYKAYREWMIAELQQLKIKSLCITLNGLTGSGKTEILKTLASEGYPTLNLEEMAGHRGSIFGEIGLKPNSQKMFDSFLVEKLQCLNEKEFFLMEAESKRIGKIVLPDIIMQLKYDSPLLFLEVPLHERINHIMKEYSPALHQNEILRAFDYIKRRIHSPISKKIEEYLYQARFYEALELLLEYYYDPMYRNKLAEYKNKPIVIQAETIQEAKLKIQEAIASLLCDLRAQSSSR